MMSNLNIELKPICTHPGTEEDCIVALINYDGQILDIDRGGFLQGETHEEWEEVADDVKVKIWEEEEDGRWWSVHDTVNEPSHWAPLPVITNTEGE